MSEQTLENLHSAKAFGYTVSNGDITAGALPDGTLDRLSDAAKKSAIAITVAGAMAGGAAQAAETVEPVPTANAGHVFQTDDYQAFAPSSASSSEDGGPNCVGGGIKNTLNSINPFNEGLSLRKLANIGVAVYTSGASLAAGAVANVGDGCMFDEPATTRAGQFGQTVARGALHSVAGLAGGDASMAVSLPLSVASLTTDVVDKPFIGGKNADAAVAPTEPPSWQSLAKPIDEHVSAPQAATADWQSLAKPAAEIQERDVYLDDRGYEIVDHQSRNDGSKFGNAFVELQQGGQTTWQSMAVKDGEHAADDVAEVTHSSPSLGG
ncbi:hypothetical protein [Marinobacterium sp. BA1]|uniref:hypothetical protein n=1 Tax=Marinobacterium sp. BA1 TaxID=3138931 RepID=UPI0032E5BC19